MIFVDRSVLAPPPELLIFHREELDRLRPIFESSQISRTQRRPGFSLPLPIRREVRRTLHEIFDGKCAFCERPASDIAHFRPAWHATRHDGRIDPDCYWWLASDWQNLHLCCAECNVRKTNLFPIAAEPAKPETFGAQLGSELPRLLDPCLDRPEDHLRFKSSGEVVPLTLRGEFTVHILELNNPELRYLRKRRAERVLRYCEDFWISDPDNAEDPVRFKERALSMLGSNEYLAVTRMVVDDFLINRFDMPAAPDVPPILAPIDLALPKPVWLDKIEIRNFKSIDALDLTFPSLDESAPPDLLEESDLSKDADRRIGQPWLMVLGENGVGKSSLLQAIALALMPAVERESLASAHTWLRRQKNVQAGYIRLTFSDGSKRTLSFEKKNKRFTVDGDRPAMSVLAYGSTRLLPRRTRGQLQPAPVSVRNLFDHTHPLSNAERYLCDRNALAETDFQLLAGSLKNLLPISEDTELERKGAHLSARLPGRHVSLSELSDGYKSMLALAMDIMFHLSNSSFDMESVRGLVMIDELELHLHPRWKVVIVDQLRTLFPNVRFVATTHDPLCVLGLRSNELHVLAVDAATQGIVHDPIDVPRGTSADEILTGPWFGVASTIDAETQLLMSEHSRLLQRGTRSQGDEARRTQLEDVLAERLGNFASTRTQRAVLAASAVLNPRVPESHLDHVLQHRLSGLLARESGAPRAGNRA